MEGGRDRRGEGRDAGEQGKERDRMGGKQGGSRGEGRRTDIFTNFHITLPTLSPVCCVGSNEDHIARKRRGEATKGAGRGFWIGGGVKKRNEGDKILFVEEGERRKKGEMD